MNFGSFNLSMFGPRLLLALGYTIASLFLFALFPMISGAGNTVHLESREEGACETSNGTRFARLAPVGTNTTADDVNWGGNGVLTASRTSATANTCTLSAAPGGTTAIQFYTESGDKITLTPTAETDMVIEAGKIVASPAVTGVGPASMFQDQPGLVGLVVGAIALIIGIGPIVILGLIGYKLLGMFKSGGGGNNMALYLMAALGAVIVVSLLGTFIDFISISYNAVDANRYVVYSVNLASLAGTIRQFWGVIFIASFLGLGGMFAYQGYQKYRGASRRGGGESQMMA